MLDFNADGMKELHFLTEKLNFPVAIPVYSDWQKTQFQYLQNNIKDGRYNSYDICKWCILHGLQYNVIYSLSKKTIFKHPYKYYKYLEMMFKLKNIHCKLGMSPETRLS